MSSRKPSGLSEKDKEAYLKLIAAGWTNKQAAEKVNRNPSTIWRLRQREPAFQAAYDVAAAEGTDCLEDEARRRAVDGVLEDQYYRGAVVGQVRRYSDVLLMFLLKSRDRERFSDKQEIKHTGDANLVDRLTAGRNRLRKVHEEDETPDFLQ